MEWQLLPVVFLSKSLASPMRNYFPKRTSGAPLHTLSKLYDVPVGFYLPPPPLLRQCFAIFAVAEVWLLLDFGWFVLFRNRYCGFDKTWHEWNTFSDLYHLSVSFCVIFSTSNTFDWSTQPPPPWNRCRDLNETIQKSSSSTMFLYFLQICQQIWSRGHLTVWCISDFRSETVVYGFRGNLDGRKKFKQ